MGRIIKAVILAGGRGERLKPLTNHIPKPMIRINNKPLLLYDIELFRNYGIVDIILSVCYLPQVIKNYFGNGKKFGINISYSLENKHKPLGTSGAIKKLQKKIRQTLILCYGDTLRQINIRKLLEFHREKKATATICIYENKRPNPKSSVIYDENNRIISFEERPKELKIAKVWSNAGLYVLEPEIFSYIPKTGPSDFGKDVFPKLLMNDSRIYAYIQKGYFLDIGTKEKIIIAENDIKERKFVCS